MFDLSFSYSDIPKVFFLSFLEIILSADNAVVLGLIASKLPENIRKKALYIGSISAFFLRLLTLLVLSFLVQYRWIQLVGAAYLLYLSIRYFYKRKRGLLPLSPKMGLWKVIVLIELFDLAFAIDSILAGIAFISTGEGYIDFSKIWIVYVGGMMGLLGIRYAAHIFSNIIDRFPRMEPLAHVMIGWIAIRLVYELFPRPAFFEPVFWMVLAGLFFLGFSKKDSKKHG